MNSLTKENFWNELHEKYPKSVQQFCDWIDKYKKKVDWNKLFNSDSDWQDANGKNAPAPKFHDLPIAMQIGILLQYMSEKPIKYGIIMPDIAHNFTSFPELIKDFFSSENAQMVPMQPLPRKK